MNAALESEVRAMISAGEKKCSDDIKTNIRFVATYKALFGTELCGACPGKIKEALNKMAGLFTNDKKFIPMSERKYQMGDQVLTIVTPIKGVPDHVSKHNLTDEVAEALLKAHPEFSKWITPVGSEINREGNSFLTDGSDTSGLATDQKANLKAAEKIYNDFTKEEIAAKLTALKTGFDPKATKKDLSIILATVQSHTPPATPPPPHSNPSQ